MTVPMERVENRISTMAGHFSREGIQSVMLRAIRHWRMIDYAVH